ncbi:MAG: threonine aldolase, partial [Gemmatimonadetes bacterium]|nr:threonine aldolase [Gemmatimonadota bacterium]
ARHANAMAQHLAGRVRQIPGVEVIYPVEANAVFARLPLPVIPVLQREFFFYPWDAAKGEVRWMTSFDTEASDVEAFAALIETTMAKGT